MSCDCDSPLEAFKGSLYYVYFKDLPDDLIEAALGQVECLPRAAFILGRCKNAYCTWLVASAQSILLDLIQSVDADTGEISVTPSNGHRYLKKRKILDIECEWAEVSKCLDCSSTTRNKITLIADDIYQKCRNTMIALGLGIGGDCENQCFTCEGGKIRFGR